MCLFPLRVGGLGAGSRTSPSGSTYPVEAQSRPFTQPITSQQGVVEGGVNEQVVGPPHWSVGAPPPCPVSQRPTPGIPLSAGASALCARGFLLCWWRGLAWYWVLGSISRVWWEETVKGKMVYAASASLSAKCVQWSRPCPPNGLLHLWGERFGPVSRVTCRHP